MGKGFFWTFVGKLMGMVFLDFRWQLFVRYKKSSEYGGCHGTRFARTAPTKNDIIVDEQPHPFSPR
jgi:hypothetical protein